MTDPMDPYRAPDPYQPADPYRAVDPYQAASPPISGTPATAPLPVPYAPPPASHGGYGAVAGYGFDPVTGQPLSDKSKIVAGLLQLLLGLVFALGGVGRLYAGHTGLGVAQIVVSMIGWTAFWCGLVTFFVGGFLAWFLSGAAWLWFVIDGIIMLAGRPVDGQGRLLRS